MADLNVLRQYLDSMGGTVTLAPGDARLPGELTAFLGSVPVSQLTMVLGPGGVGLSGGVLTVTGSVAAGSVAAEWPITGLGKHAPVTVRVTRVSLTLTNAPAAGGSTATTVAGTARGILTLGGPVEVALASVELPVVDGSQVTAWRLAPAVPAQLGIGQLLNLGSGDPGTVPGRASGPLARLPVLPPALQATAAIGPGDLALTFYPGTDYEPLLTFTARVPQARWTVVTDLLELDGATVRAVVAPGRWQVSLIGSVAVGGVGVQVGLRVGDSSRWTAFLRPAEGEAFPGLAALAGWVGGRALASAVGSGLAAVDLAPAGLDAAISAVELAFDAGTRKLISVEIGTLVSVGALRFDVAFSLPNLRISGLLHGAGPVSVVDVLSSLSLPSGGLPRALSINEASFTADLALGYYTAHLTLGDVWTVGPVTLRQLALGLRHSAAAGLGGSIEARLAVGSSITLMLEAEYVDSATGWSFEGTMWNDSKPAVADLIGSLSADYGITAAPAALGSLSLEYVSARFATGTGDLAFQATGGFRVAGVKATLDVDIAITHPAQPPTSPDTAVGTRGYAAKYGGTLTIGSLSFQVAFDTRQTGTDVRLAARWRASAGRPYLDFGDLAEALGLSGPQVPEGLDLRLKSADLTYDVTKGELLIAAQSETYGSAVFVVLPVAGQRLYAGALAIGHPIDLSDIPLLGQALGEDDTFGVQDLRVIVSSTPLTDAAAAAANALVPAGYPGFPVRGTAAQVAFSAVMRFGEQTIPLALGVAPAPRAGSVPAPSGTTVGASAGPGGVVAQPAATSDGTVWFRVEKAFGPITVSRVGARYGEGALWFVLDASLEAGGLSLVLQGAGVGSPVTTFAPRFDLRGLTIEYAEPPLAIGGGFSAVAPTGGADFQYDGSAVVSMADWSALAYGSYTEVHGHPSLFLFLKAAGSFGGPPAFFVTALAAGFGYNSTVRVPTAEQVADFPLVAGLNDPARLGGPDATPARALASLSGGPNPWISPAPGQTWLAAGVRFKSFQQLDSTALLLAEFGDGLTVLLLGVSTARFPNSGAARPYAQIQLQLHAAFRPDDGFFGVTAALTRNSFLIDPACVLTGGFAFHAWFGESEHAGDFVVVIGGYHPAFRRPAHYPAVSRVGFSWSLDSAVRISGSAYFALTPSAIMAGGSLDVRYHDGNLTAWFTAHADLLVNWSPFHFRAGIGVSVGVEYEVNLLFTTTTLRLEAGADLTLWGPPTGGTVTVRLWIITFTVAFGAPDSPNPPALDWNGFQALLPAPAAGTTFTATSGLAAARGDNAARRPQPQAPWSVRADGFALTVRNAVPSTKVLFGSAAQTPAISGSRVDIRPMRRTGLTVNQRVVLTRTGGGPAGELDLAASGWRTAAVRSNVPKALWGTGTGAVPDPGDAQLVTGQLTGLTLQAPAPVTGWSAGPIDAANVLGAIPVTPGGVLPVAPLALPAGEAAVHGDAVSAVAAQFASSAGRAARDALFAALADLGAAPPTNGPVARFAAAADTEFADQPLLAGTAL
jgi:hypothetical protein